MAVEHAAATTPPPLVRGAVAQRPSTPAARQTELEQCQILAAPASLLRPRPGTPPSVCCIDGESSPGQHRTGIMYGRLEVPLVLASAITGSAAGDDGSPTAPVPIASLTSAAHSYGSAEAGKRATDRMAVTVADSTGAPIAGASWRWQTDHHSGWIYPPKGITDTDGASRPPGSPARPGPGVLTLSRLDHRAFAIAVYASPTGSLPHSARLASGCGPRSTGRDWLPAGRPRKVSDKS